MACVNVIAVLAHSGRKESKLFEKEPARGRLYCHRTKLKSMLAVGSVEGRAQNQRIDIDAAELFW